MPTRWLHAPAALVACLALCLGLAPALAGGAAESESEAETGTASPAPPPKPDWDQIANIKDAAARIGKLQRAKGPEAAFKFIDACYRTHSLAESYTAAFEACIAQDYLQTKMLVQLYQRTPPAVLKKFGSPSPEVLADSMGRRIVGAFNKYGIAVSDANAFKDLVDKHGLPIFVAAAFPEAVKELNERSQDKSNSEQFKDRN